MFNGNCSCGISCTFSHNYHHLHLKRFYGIFLILFRIMPCEFEGSISWQKSIASTASRHWNSLQNSQQFSFGSESFLRLSTKMGKIHWTISIRTELVALGLWWCHGARLGQGSCYFLLDRGRRMGINRTPSCMWSIESCSIRGCCETVLRSCLATAPPRTCAYLLFSFETHGKLPQVQSTGRYRVAVPC